MGKSTVRKRVRPAKECQHFEYDLLVDKSYDKFLRLVQAGDENLECVKSEPLDFDFDELTERPKFPNKRNVKASDIPKHSRRVGVMEDVNLEDPDSDSDSDSGWNHGISEPCSKRPHLETSNSLKKEKINRTSSTDWKKGKMVQQSVRRKCRRKGLSIHIDETIEAFLNQCKMNGDQMIYAPRIGTRKIYEEDMQSSSDSERTVPDNNHRDGCHRSSVKNKAANSRSFSKGKGVMKRKMSCPKNYEDTYSHSHLNEEDCHQDDRYRASFGKRKTPTKDLEDLRPQKSSAAKKKKKKNTKEALNTVGAELDLANQDYEAFLAFAEVDGKNFIYTLKNCGRKLYEGVEIRSDETHRDPLNNIHTMDTEAAHSIENQNQFRKGLIENLGRPYDLLEHLNLFRDAHKEGPSDHEIDLLNEIEPCQTPRQYGNSYLVVYKDLSEKIYEAKANDDQSRSLYLLRGLFYWLKNKSQEGGFIPWKDKICLKM